MRQLKYKNDDITLETGIGIQIHIKYPTCFKRTAYVIIYDCSRLV